MSKKRNKKRGSAITDFLPWLILGILFLALMIGVIFYLKSKGIDLIAQIKNLFGQA